MGAISFRDGPAWVVGRWAFRRFMEDVASAVQDQPELVREIEREVLMEGLHFALIDPSLAKRLLPVVRKVAVAISQNCQDPGFNWWANLDEEGQASYRAAAAELVQLIDEQRSDPQFGPWLEGA